MKRVKVKIHGLVQGVFYRANTRDKAKQIGVTGWVKNMPDNTVEAVFEGEADKVDEMIEWCKTGPPSAEVEKIEILENEQVEINSFKSFEIKY